jgi:uncharacterized protein YndB with AHSA1/START domain
MDAKPANPDLTITRTFNAPRSLVFDAWTQGEHLARWSGPEGFTTPHAEMDLRPGGKYRACLRAPDGTDHWLQGVYKEISPPGRLVMTHAWLQEDGSTSPETLITVTLRELAPDKTEMTFHQGPFGSIPERDGHQGGWSTSFDKLEAHLARAARA